MEEITTVKRMKVDDWYFKVHRLSSILNLCVTCLIVALILPMALAVSFAIMNKSDIDLDENFVRDAMWALSNYKYSSVFVIFAFIVEIIFVLGIIFSVIGIYRKLVAVGDGNVILTDEDGVDLTLQEIGSLETYNRVMYNLFSIPSGDEEDEGVAYRWAAGQMFAYWLTTPNLSIRSLLMPTFLYGFALFGSFGPTFTRASLHNRESRDEG